jgi:putative addiction module component (TIGR02574 family)
MLSKEIKGLSVAERILLVEEIWDSVASKKIKPGKDEIIYVKNRLLMIKDGKSKSRSWDSIKGELI